MQIEIKIDSSYTNPKIIIMTASMTDEVHTIMKKLSENTPQIITGCKDDKIEVLEQTDLIRMYASSGKVFAVTDKGEYSVRLRLYELEDRLDANQFVRISNSEIINLKKVQNFDLSFTGTICVKLSNGTLTYVSRRYMSYFGIFALIFILIWIIEYMIEKHNIDRINAKLNKEE